MFVVAHIAALLQNRLLHILDLQVQLGDAVHLARRAPFFNDIDDIDCI